MIQLSVSTSTAAAQTYFEHVRDEQIPFAASLAVNNIAKKAQSGIQSGMREDFIIRRDWVTQQIKISHFSNKDDSPIYARVQVGNSADFLNKFEPGGRKTSRAGRNIAVPVAARAGRAGLVPDAMRPKTFNLRPVGKSIRGDKRTFILTLRNGRQGIFQRIGSGSGDIQLLYELVAGVPIPPSLRFVSTASTIVTDGWEAEWANAIDLALRTAR